MLYSDAGIKNRNKGDNVIILYALGGGIIGSGGVNILVSASEPFLPLQKDAVLLDCGKRAFDNKSGSLNNQIPPFVKSLEIIESPAAIKAIIISHAHIDHFGALPDVATFARYSRIYVPIGTKQFISLQLRKKVLCTSWYEEDEAIDEAMEKAVEQIIDKIIEVPSYQRISIPNSLFSFQFFPAGHIMGSAMVYLEYKQESLLFSGDYYGGSVLSTESLNFSNLPKNKIDYFLVESSFLSKKIDSEEKNDTFLQEFNNIISEIKKTKGNCVVITSAIGIAQEIMSLLIKEFHEDGKRINIIMDRSTYEITNIYFSDKNPSFTTINSVKNIFHYQLDEFFKIKEKEEPHSSLNLFFIVPQTMKKHEALRNFILPGKNHHIIASYFPTEIAQEKNNNQSIEQHLKSILNFDDSIACNLHFISFVMHANYSHFKKIIEYLDPKNIYLVHGFLHSSNLGKITQELSVERPNIFLIPMENQKKYGEIKNEVK